MRTAQFKSHVIIGFSLEPKSSPARVLRPMEQTQNLLTSSRRFPGRSIFDSGDHRLTRKRYSRIRQPGATEERKDLLSNITENLTQDQVKENAQRKGFGAQQAKPKSKKGAPAQQQKPFKVENLTNQAELPSDQWEANIVRVLTLLFIVFFCEGIFLAIAGFLPDAADNFAVNYVYPAFSPTLGVFLLISIIYGLIKFQVQSYNADTARRKLSGTSANKTASLSKRNVSRNEADADSDSSSLN